MRFSPAKFALSKIEIRPFSNLDWQGYAGAQTFSEGLDAPLICSFDFLKPSVFYLRSKELVAEGITLIGDSCGLYLEVYDRKSSVDCTFAYEKDLSNQKEARRDMEKVLLDIVSEDFDLDGWQSI